MKKLFFLFLIVVLAVAQVSIFSHFRIFSVKPDFLLVTVVAASVIFSPAWAIAFSAFAGFLKDSLGISGFSVETILFPLWSILIIKLSSKMPLDHKLIRVLVVFFTVIINAIVSRLLLLSIGSSIPSRVFLKVIIFEPVYTALLSALVFKIIHPVFVPNKEF
jgi:rod shape-determining protein MreD